MTISRIVFGSINITNDGADVWEKRHSAAPLVAVLISPAPLLVRRTDSICLSKHLYKEPFLDFR